MVRRVRARPQETAFGTPGERRVRDGFTLVELLVVIAIIGILVALLLPAIQAAREAARRNQCTNNLKQLSLGALNHESTLKQFPSTGLGYRWIGDPNYGHGRKQPGGWIFNTLPFIEEQAIHDMGSGVGSNWTDAARKKIFAERASITIKTLNCPSRRSGGPYSRDKGLETFKNQDSVTLSARSDYAGNIGDGDNGGFPPGPDKLEDTETGAWESITIPVNYKKFSTEATGVFTFWSFNRLKSITDGLSKTYCIGEKNINRDKYENGLDDGDDQDNYGGMDRDNLRFGRGEKTNPIVSAIPPMPDTPGAKDYDSSFGGAHAGVVLMAMCDGSVHGISYDIDPTMHGRLANRKDGESVTLP